jgi:hypothetical protein
LFAFMSVVIVTVSFFIGVNFAANPVEVEGSQEPCYVQAYDENWHNSPLLVRSTYFHVEGNGIADLSIALVNHHNDVFIGSHAEHDWANIRMYQSALYHEHINIDHCLLTNRFTMNDTALMDCLGCEFGSVERVLKMHLPQNAVFENIDIRVEFGDVVIEDVTVTGRININAPNGEIILTNVDVDSEMVYINGEKAFPNQTTEPFTDRPVWVERFFENISNIRVQLSLCDVLFSHGGESLTVRYYDWFERQRFVDIRVQDGTLSIDNQGGNTASGNLIPQIEIIIPYGMGFDNVSVLTGGILIDVSDITFSGNVNLHAGVGTIRADNTIFNGTASLMAAGGKLHGQGASFKQDARLRATGGIINFTSTTFAANVNMDGIIRSKGNSFLGYTNLSVNSGDIVVEECDFTQMSISTGDRGTSRISLRETIDSYDITISTNAAITLNGRQAHAYDLRNPSATRHLTFSSNRATVELTAPTR